MFADITERDRAYRLERARSQRAHEREKKTRIYALADAVYLAVYNKRPQIEIDRLLKKLSVVTTRRKSA